MSSVTHFPIPYADQWLQPIVDGLELRKISGEWHGPCPNCNDGDDRFWITIKNGELRVNCRKCDDWKAIQGALRDRGLWPPLNSGPPRLPETPVTAADLETPYHVRKKIDLFQSAILIGKVVEYPLFYADKTIAGRQRIAPNGEKRFNKGFKKDGAFGATMPIGSGETYIAEGAATAMSVTMATGLPCIIALDAGNLPKAVKAIQKHYPKITLIGAGDNDPSGIKAMQEAMIPYAVPIYEDADWNDVHVSLGLDAVKAGLKRTTKSLFRRLGSSNFPMPDPLIKGIIDKSTMCMVYGASGAKKSFVVYDMAASIATGTPWHGHRVEQGPVLVIYGEGGSGIDRRLYGWSLARGVSLEDAPLFGNERPLILTDDADIKLLTDYIEHRIEIDGTPALVVVDTLARALGAADERAGADINKLIAALGVIISDYGCAVLLVHHTGHAAKDRARGASELPAAVDHEFRVEPFDEAGIITGTLFTPTKNKDGQLGDPMIFDMPEVPLGVHDEDMVELATLVPELRGKASEFEPDQPKPMTVVVAEEQRLRVSDRLSKRELIDAVRVELGCAKRTAERWVKRAVDEGLIDV